MSQPSARPLASISLDVDNLWSYMMIHGDPGWEALPSYLDRLAPVVSELLGRLDLRLTCFIVGKDAAQPESHAALRALTAGHEVANHSLSHEPWFHTYGRPEVEREIGEAEACIEAALGVRPRGWRGPGFSFSPLTLEVLAERGYLYDASTFPTILGPLARAWYFWGARDMSEEERARRDKLFGGASEGLRPVRPYLWRTGSHGELLEIPVTTMPVFRLPFHLSYLGYLAQRSPTAARGWLRAALALCRRAGVEPSFLLHPLDFLGGDEAPELGFFPGMGTSTRIKGALFSQVIAILREGFDLVPMEEHARAIRARGGLPVVGSGRLAGVPLPA